MTAQNAVATREDRPIQLVKGFQSAIADALPTHMTKEHFSRALLTSFRRNPDLVQCEQSTIGNAVVTAAQLGLMIGVNGSCWLIPFKNKGKDECQLVIGYQGLIDLCYRSGRVESIFADVVCENDTWKFRQGLDQVLEHVPELRGDRGDPFAVYAIARITGSATPVYVVMSKQDVFRVRDSSKAYQSDIKYGTKRSPWSGDFVEEMWKKTALRRLSKLLPKSIELSQALEFENRHEERWTDAKPVEDVFAPGRHKLPSKRTQEEVKHTVYNSGPIESNITLDQGQGDEISPAAISKRDDAITYLSQIYDEGNNGKTIDSILDAQGQPTLTEIPRDTTDENQIAALIMAKMQMISKKGK